ncbi:hypothetical protein V1505DRAFT_47365 [Lipomyces doorenjongii]
MDQARYYRVGKFASPSSSFQSQNPRKRPFLSDDDDDNTDHVGICSLCAFRKDWANREDIVTSALVTGRPESRCSRYGSCKNHENERYFSVVDRLFSCTWHRKDHQIALVKVFDEDLYANNQDEIYGRVQTLEIESRT